MIKKVTQFIFEMVYFHHEMGEQGKKYMSITLQPTECHS